MAKRNRQHRRMTTPSGPSLVQQLQARAYEHARSQGHKLHQDWQSSKHVWNSRGAVRTWCLLCGHTVHVVPKGTQDPISQHPFITGSALLNRCGSSSGPQTPHECLSGVDPVPRLPLT